MGTLDPMAEGVLPVGVGQASRLFQYLLDKQKTYVARFIFGYSTDTLDVTGQETERTNKVPSLEEIKKVMAKFVGEIDQIPPKYSAKCIDGKRGYQLARKGVDFELAPKKVTILSAEVLGQVDENEFEFKFTCKGGTYIRSICRDLAKSLNTFATMTALKRIKSGAFSIENCINEEDILKIKDLNRLLIKPDSVLTLDKITLSEKDYIELINGRPFVADYKDGTYSVYSHLNEFVGVGILTDKKIKIKAFIKDL